MEKAKIPRWRMEELAVEVGKAKELGLGGEYFAEKAAAAEMAGRPDEAAMWRGEVVGTWGAPIPDPEWPVGPVGDPGKVPERRKRKPKHVGPIRKGEVLNPWGEGGNPEKRLERQRMAANTSLRFTEEVKRQLASKKAMRDFVKAILDRARDGSDQMAKEIIGRMEGKIPESQIGTRREVRLAPWMEGPEEGRPESPEGGDEAENA